MNVTKVVSNRNGVCGAPFYSVYFTDENRNFVAMIFPKYDDSGDVIGSDYYGVVCVNEPDLCWRGDYYVDECIEHIKAKMVADRAKYARMSWEARFSMAARNAPRHCA